ncbi:hypothetical protein CY34DRAFT_799549 [Suillus luteus UH-Slu-Lm8-n1]|uniref:Uncharacterized protein n=1 Tax=Suillus luteus UH-Slu-Lm8-n1 TaxID=930992 RepID=A0A0D0AAB0_9AGAM|nr:hypothetical protein CY34DRAFT_799549 [Suillus luteus UH-Slu-Lm8-n1]
MANTCSSSLPRISYLFLSTYNFSRIKLTHRQSLIIFDVPHTGTNLHSRLTIFFAAGHLYLCGNDGNSATWRRSKALTMNKRLQDRCIHPVQNPIDITYVIDHHGYFQREGRALQNYS